MRIVANLTQFDMDIPPTPSLPAANLTAKVVRGGAWVYGQMMFTNIINLGVMAILARQLTPADFGLVAIAHVLLRLLVLIATEGVNQYVIYDNADGREERVQAAFWMDLTFSTISVIAGMALIPFVTGFYAEPDLAPVLTLLLIRFWMDAFSKVPDALVKKQLDFQKLVVRDTILEILASIGSVVLALSGWGVWSLVLPGLFVSPVRAFVIFHLAHWRPTFRFYFRSWPQIFSYSANVVGTNLTTLILNEGDTLLIGKLMGSGLLGIYNLAWQTANMVSRTIVSLTNKLALPTLAAVSNDPLRLRSAVHRMLRILAIITFPLLVGLFVVADDFVIVLYGQQWQEAVLPLRILLIYAMRYAVGSPAGMVYKAVGRPEIGFKLGLIMVPFYLLSIWWGSSYGIIGVAVGVTLTRTIFGFIGFELLARCLDEGLWSILTPMASTLVASFAMGILVFAAGILFAQFIEINLIWNLLLQVGFGAIIYLALLRTVYRGLAHELAQLSMPIAGRFQGLVRKTLGIVP